MALERIRETFNDGVLLYGTYKTIRSESRKTIGKDFVQQGRLFYKELSIRDKDYLKFGAMGSSLDIKVKTNMPPNLRSIDKNAMIVKINDDEFNIVGTDRDKQYLYFYLHRIDKGKGDPIE
nr:phage head closure protein [Heyndrickxia oleronia]